MLFGYASLVQGQVCRQLDHFRMMRLGWSNSDERAIGRPVANCPGTQGVGGEPDPLVTSVGD